MSEPTQPSAPLPARQSAQLPAPDDHPGKPTYTPPDKPFEVWLAVRVPAMAQTLEEAERQAFAVMDETIDRLTLALWASDAKGESATRTKATQTGHNDRTVLHFGEVAVRVLNQMSQEKNEGRT